MPDFVGVADAARRIGARRVDVSKVIYDGAIREDLAPLVGGRRLVRVDALEQVRAALVRRGKVLIPSQGASDAK